MRKSVRSAVLAVLALALAGCGVDTPASPLPDGSGPAAITTAAPEPTPAALDAETVLAKLTAAKLPITDGAIQDEDTDPNNLLGRPNGYTSRASADVTGIDKEGADKYSIDRGLVIEVFADKALAENRSKFIQDSLASFQILGTEYHYRADDGRVLVRVSGKAKPSLAKKIETVVASI